ncbi:DUF1992 domain-containing protein [Nocardioides albus]|uniref:DnaJ homologue subfamily C member 28 conserved domain-containing protein n=1 Tax=Nocardioides albus TaxID=1841 RepID=A0A7W5F7B4_9ACTN|nr:DUF1992 domain-containing protein [Nocardioides albus]MBB3087836.1 hypothetical protein [Nocardioides albus]GGU20611.1 hypothetical protein GCM10007979_19010 [Nocardioides albus]
MTDQELSIARGGVLLHDPYAVAIDEGVAVTLLADLQVRRAIARGEFDDLPGSGEPIDLPDQHDPEWWVRSIVQREHIALLPPSIQLRKDDAALDGRLDEMSDETAVRREIDDFNVRVVRARYELPSGPPLITMPRDPDATVQAWADRRAARAERGRQAARVDDPAPRRRRRRFRLFRSR